MSSKNRKKGPVEYDAKAAREKATSKTQAIKNLKSKSTSAPPVEDPPTEASPVTPATTLAQPTYVVLERWTLNRESGNTLTIEMVKMPQGAKPFQARETERDPQGRLVGTPVRNTGSHHRPGQMTGIVKRLARRAAAGWAQVDHEVVVPEETAQPAEATEAA